MSNEESETESDVSGSGSTVTGDESSTHSSDYETATDSSEEDEDDQPNDPNSNNTSKKPPTNIDAQLNGTNNTEQYATDSDEDTDDSGSGDTDSDSDGSGSTATDDTDDDEEDTENGDDDDENVESSPPAEHSPGITKRSSDEDEASSSEEEEDTEEESAGDDEEAEPQLKYQRLGGGVTDKVKKDLASCLKCHPRFLVLGMKSGIVYVLDPHGDIIKQYRPHKNAVNDISIDQNGDHVATCSQDGKLSLHSLSIYCVLCVISDLVSVE